jgi:hypothetical protein
MKEAKVILPHTDNDGRSLFDLHGELARTICQLFGGCTIADGRGCWLNGDKLFDETVAIFHVAAEDNETNNRALRHVARTYGALAKQLAVYVVDFSGNAAVIDLPQLSTVSN